MIVIAVLAMVGLSLRQWDSFKRTDAAPAGSRELESEHTRLAENRTDAVSTVALAASAGRS